jgi:flagellar biosynthesis protein FlhF
MQIKTFEATSFKDAVKAVKLELGADAVILSTREKEIDGRPNSRMVEVTAAAPATSRQVVGGQSAGPREGTDRIATACMQKIEARMESIDSKMASSRRLENLEASVHDLKLLLLEVLKQGNHQAEQTLPPEASEVVRQLRHANIDEMLLARLASALSRNQQEKPGNKNTDTSSRQVSSENWYRDQAIRWMLKQITVAPRWDSLPGSQSVHCLVGPPGSGKSTMICKLAAQFNLREKSKVLLVSYDTVRLAASEQLRVYAKVMNIAFEAIQQASDLQKAIAKHPDASLVLVDTTGRPVKQGNVIEDLNALKKAAPAIDFHLVLSATEKLQALDSAVRAHSELGIRSIAFSRLDDSWQFADAFNIAAKWSVPLSFFGTGPEIPEAIERASRERIVEQVFGLSRA